MNTNINKICDKNINDIVKDDIKMDIDEKEEKELILIDDMR